MNHIEAAWAVGEEEMLPFCPRTDADAVVALVRHYLPTLCEADVSRVLQWCRFVICLASMDREAPPASVLRLIDELSFFDGEAHRANPGGACDTASSLCHPSEEQGYCDDSKSVRHMPWCA